MENTQTQNGTQTNTATNQPGQYELNAFETQPEPKTTGAPYIKDQDIINIDQVKEVTDKEFVFDDKTVKRKLCTMKDGTQLVIPISLNNEIVALCKANKGKVHRVQVKIEGTGKTKKYRAIPLL